MNRWHATPQSSEPPDIALDDAVAIGIAIAVLLVIVFLSSWLP